MYAIQFESSAAPSLLGYWRGELGVHGPLSDPQVSGGQVVAWHGFKDTIIVNCPSTFIIFALDCVRKCK